MVTDTRNGEGEAWAARELAGRPDAQAAAVTAAVEALDQGLSARAAAMAARLSSGTPIPSADATALWDEINGLDAVARELATVKPSGELTAAALEQLLAEIRTRREATRDLYAAAREAIVSATPGSIAEAHAAPRPPGPSMREFFADNSILLISIAGAVLLMVSTLLFEIYGASGLGGQAQFGAVFALNLVFGAAGYVCLGRPRLRLVGHTYLAIFALMAPLTVAAAWVFLNLSSRGISSEEAAAFGGIGCSLLYGLLGYRLASRPYAALSLLALAAGYQSAIVASPAGAWGAAWFALLTFAYIVIALAPRGWPRELGPFTRVAWPFVHGSALVAVVWAAFELGSELTYSTGGRSSFQLALTLALLSVAYAVYAWRSGRRWLIGMVWIGTSLTAIAAVDPLGWGANGYVAVLVVLAWGYAIGSRRMPGRRLRQFLRIGAAVQAAIPMLLSASPDGLQAVALFAAAGVGLMFAVEDAQPAWLLLTFGIFTADWFWIVKALVPPPPNPTADTLVAAYSPLPVIYAATGIGLRFARREGWAWPAYVAAALVVLGVMAGASGSDDLTLAGRSLAAYAVSAYAVAALHRWWQVMVAALLAAAAALELLLAAAGVATYWYPLATAALAWAIYAAAFAWGTSRLGLTHRYSAIGIAAVAAVGCFAVPDYWQAGGPGALASLAALGTAAAMVFVDGRLHRQPRSDYIAPAAASAAGFWVARYAGVDNLQADVALTGITLIVLGLVAARDSRRPVRLGACRAAIGVGGAILLGTTAFQSVTDSAASFYTVVWVVEAVVALLAGIGTRSRTLVLVGAVGIAAGSLRALFLILESVQVYVVFGAIAILLLAGAGVLAATRDRIAVARSAVRTSWDHWT